MLQSNTCPNTDHPTALHLSENSAVWGRAITPSVAHLVQTQHELVIEYSRMHPGTVVETASSVAILPHVINESTFRIHVESKAFHSSVCPYEAAAKAFIQCDVGAECTLKLWGHVATESPPTRSDQVGSIDVQAAATVPVNFTVAFWEISRIPDDHIGHMIKQLYEKDRKIRELVLKVALAACSQ